MRLLPLLLLCVCCGTLVAAEAPAASEKKAPQPRKKRTLPQWDFVPRAEFEANFAEFSKRLRKQGPERVAPEMKVEKEERFPGYIRRLVSYRVGEEERITGWLLIPEDLKPGEKRPLMLTLHGTNVYGKDAAIGFYDAYPAGDAKEQAARANRAFALDLVQRGFICFAPDRAGYGERAPAGVPRGIPAMNAYMKDFQEKYPQWDYHHGKVVQDLQQALDFLVELPEVDAEHIGTIGHSLGGRDSMEIAAFDPRIKAVVMSCGGNLSYQPQLWQDAAAQRSFATQGRLNSQGMSTNFFLQAIAPRAFLGILALNDYLTDYPSNLIDAARPFRSYYDMLLGEKKLPESDRLQILLHSAGHDAPLEVRQAAYAWLERQLNLHR